VYAVTQLQHFFGNLPPDLVQLMCAGMGKYHNTTYLDFDVPSSAE
jgi:hypothetical protein